MADDLVRNRKASHDYHLLETWEAGLVLTGSEVKSLRAGKGNLQDAYVDAQGRDLWLKQAHFAPYDHGGYANHEPLRPRKLLLNRAEIQRILSKVDRKGYTLVPLAIYLNERGKIKVRIALAEGKQAHDKREALEERERKREMDRIRKGERE